MVRIPVPIAAGTKLREGDCIEVEPMAGGWLRLTPLRETSLIDELVAGITEENRHEETEWGTPTGNEAW